MRDWEKKVTEILARLAKDEADIAYLLSPIVSFPDPALEAAVRAAIGVPSGNIHQSDLIPITSFSATGLGIVDLTGMEYWTSLTGLALGYNSIVDISPLAGLTALTSLDLDNNSIVDISPLAGLTALTLLDLSGNSIVDISPLAGLTALNWLNLGGNSIVDISPLVGVMASGNQIINGNPLNVHAYHTDIPAILAIGVAVMFDVEPTPAAIAINPMGGTTAGGTPVDITGTGFLHGATATIDGNPCTTVIFVSDTELTAVTPAGAAGAKDVVVTNDVNFGTAAAAFTYS